MFHKPNNQAKFFKSRRYIKRGLIPLKMDFRSGKTGFNRSLRREDVRSEIHEHVRDGLIWEASFESDTTVVGAELTESEQSNEGGEVEYSKVEHSSGSGGENDHSSCSGENDHSSCSGETKHSSDSEEDNSTPGNGGYSFGDFGNGILENADCQLDSGESSNLGCSAKPMVCTSRPGSKYEVSYQKSLHDLLSWGDTHQTLTQDQKTEILTSIDRFKELISWNGIELPPYENINSDINCITRYTRPYLIQQTNSEVLHRNFASDFAPNQPEYFRTETIVYGLCPYCVKINFFSMREDYDDHLGQVHRVFRQS